MPNRKPGERVGKKGNQIETIPKPPVAQKFGNGLQIVLIGAVLANVFILYVGAMPGSRQRRKSKKRPNDQTQSEKTIRPRMVYLETLERKRDDSISPALFGALAGRFLGVGENYINPRRIQIARIAGPGRV